MKNQIITDLLAGKIVTIPTETVEGYAVSLKSEPAIRKLMQLKDRDFNSGKVFTLIPESKSAIENYVIIPEKFKPIIAGCLPGEFTFILPKNPKFKNYYYDHFNNIGIRLPDYDFFKHLQEKVGPMILTSANPRGGTPKTLTGHLPSTVVDLTHENPIILRQGTSKFDLQ